MPPMKTEDDLRLLYNMVKLSPTKAATADVAKSMGLKQSATNWRIQALFKRLDKEFGPADGNEPVAAVTTKANAENKRKRSSNEDDSSVPKSKKQESDEDRAVKAEAAVDGGDTTNGTEVVEKNDA